MTALSKRRMRIVRVRAIEHRIAAARNAEAERRSAELVGVATRLANLRHGLCPQPGSADGQTLQAMAEMAQRLDRAEGELVQPMQQADAHQQRTWLARLAARAREESSVRLRDRAAATEQYAAMVRADAARPFSARPRRRG